MMTINSKKHLVIRDILRSQKDDGDTSKLIHSPRHTLQSVA